MKTMIDTKRLMALAQQHGWLGQCLYLLLYAAGIKTRNEAVLSQPITHEERESIPETIAYDAIVNEPHRYFDVNILLDMAESVHGVDPLKSGGMVLCAMTRELFIPAIPNDHPGYIASLRLLRVFEAYIGETVRAEHYIKEAYNHRTTFCSVWGNEADPEFEHLFAAMPNSGLETPMALNGWMLNGSWESFGRHLARSMPGFDLLERLEEEIDEALFVEDHEEHDREATEAAHQLVDEQMRYLRLEALEPFENRIADIVDAFMRGQPVQEDGNGAA